MLLPAAEICTIDSFCSTVVKRYFHELGIAPDFRMLDDSERAALEDEVVTNCINTLCEKKSAAFYDLSNLFSLGSSDATLKDAILTLFRNAQVYPSPERWLREIPADYSPALSIQESIWYPLILQNIRERIEEGKRAAQQALDLMCDDAPLAEAYAPAIEKDLQILSALEALASSATGTLYWNTHRIIKIRKKTLNVFQRLIKTAPFRPMSKRFGKEPKKV